MASMDWSTTCSYSYLYAMTQMYPAAFSSMTPMLATMLSSLMAMMQMYPAALYHMTQSLHMPEIAAICTTQFRPRKNLFGGNDSNLLKHNLQPTWLCH